MTNIQTSATLVLSLVLSACAASEPSVPLSMKVRSSVVSGEKAAKDEPAASAFRALSELVTNKSHMDTRLGVYRLREPNALSERLTMRRAELGFSTSSTVARDDHMHVSTVTNGKWTLRLNDYNDSEELFDSERDHRGIPVPESALPGDDEFIAAALEHSKRRLARYFDPGSSHLYKVRKYYNAHSSGSGTIEDGVDQVAVAFNQTVDGLPVIGPGGKVSVHMATDKTIVRHEHALRQKAGLLHLIAGGVDLLTPSEAEAIANSRLDGTGIDRSKFVVARKELGYYLGARRTIQTIMAPHYAFFFEPLPGEMSKKLVEIVPATNDADVLALLAKDSDAEAARKASRMATPDQQKAR